MVYMATKMMWHVNYKKMYIIVDQNTKYGEDWAYIDKTVRNVFI